MPEHYDPSFWAVVTGIPLLAIFVAALFTRRKAMERARERAGLPPSRSPAATAPDAPDADAQSRRRPTAPPSPASEHELASAVRSTILRTVAERIPTGWTALVLCPPPHASLMAWHLHLAPEVALDVPDGRSIPVGPPVPTHEWQMPGGRSVGVGGGDPDPAPSSDTLAVRVSGPYLQVTVKTESGQPAALVARVEGAPEGSPELRAAPTDLRASQGAIREGIELAIGTRMLGTPPTLAYRLGAWAGHDRVWLTVGR